MKFESLRSYLRKKKGAVEEFPFGPTAMVFKVMGKIFALIAWKESPLRINLKCDPDLAIHLRRIYMAVKPGYHMNKDHWNTVIVDGSISDDEILSMIDDSYNLVVNGLKKDDKKRVERL
jgi:predicted DNA-binding protein (MmcQ/YjbR family)